MQYSELNPKPTKRDIAVIGGLAIVLIGLVAIFI
jgi:hypothetical protein